METEKIQILDPPGPCCWCGEWIEEDDLFFRDNFGRLICLECYNFWTDGSDYKTIKKYL